MARLMELRAVLDATYKTNLALGARASASNVRDGCDWFGAGRAVDGKPDTFWATDEGSPPPRWNSIWTAPQDFQSRHAAGANYRRAAASNSMPSTGGTRVNGMSSSAERRLATNGYTGSSQSRQRRSACESHPVPLMPDPEDIRALSCATIATRGKSDSLLAPGGPELLAGGHVGLDVRPRHFRLEQVRGAAEEPAGRGRPVPGS